MIFALGLVLGIVGGIALGIVLGMADVPDWDYCDPCAGV